MESRQPKAVSASPTASRPFRALATTARMEVWRLPSEQRKDVWAAVREGRPVRDPGSAKAAVDLARARIVLGPPSWTLPTKVLLSWRFAVIYLGIVLVWWGNTRNLLVAVVWATALLVLLPVIGAVAYFLRRDQWRGWWEAAHEALRFNEPIAEAHGTKGDMRHRGGSANAP